MNSTGMMVFLVVFYVATAIGIEIEGKYCEIAVKRLSQEVLKF